MSTKIKTMGICAIVIGAVFVFLGFKANAEREALAKSGISVPGVITSAKIDRGSKNKKRHHLMVTWNAGETAHNDQRFLVKKAFFDSKVHDGTEVKMPDVTVRYVPGQEADAIIVGGSSDFVGMEYLGYIVAFIGVVICWFSFRKRAPAPAQ